MRSFRGPCKKLRFEICEYNFIDRFKLKITQRTYFIRPKSCLQNRLQNLCSSCLQCKACCKQYTVGTEDFWPSTTTTDVPTESFWKTKKLNKSYFALFLQKQIIMVRMIDKVRLIDQADNLEEPRRKKSFWKQELGTFQPNRLNGLEVAFLQCSKQIFSFFKR